MRIIWRLFLHSLNPVLSADRIRECRRPLKTDKPEAKENKITKESSNLSLMESNFTGVLVISVRRTPQQESKGRESRSLSGKIRLGDAGGCRLEIILPRCGPSASLSSTSVLVVEALASDVDVARHGELKSLVVVFSHPTQCRLVLGDTATFSTSVGDHTIRLERDLDSGRASPPTSPASAPLQVSPPLLCKPFNPVYDVSWGSPLNP